MTRYARIADGLVAEIITLSDDIAPEQAFHPDIAATIVPCPDANVLEGATWDGSKFGPAPPPPTPDPSTVPLITFKADVIRRSTDDEADALDAALNVASSKLRLLWNSVTVIDHTADEFQTLHDAVLSALSAIMPADQAAARTTVLLMPSE